VWLIILTVRFMRNILLVPTSALIDLMEYIISITILDAFGRLHLTHPVSNCYKV